MSTETFTWSPLADPVGTKTFKIMKAQFGDGYSQAAADGMNNSTQSWPLSFSGYASEITPIMEFLDRHQGWKSFFWTPPLGTMNLYRVESYTLQAGQAGTNYTLNAVFTEVYKP